jgi:hypothetical protein
MFSHHKLLLRDSGSMQHACHTSHHNSVAGSKPLPRGLWGLWPSAILEIAQFWHCANPTVWVGNRGGR